MRNKSSILFNCPQFAMGRGVVSSMLNESKISAWLLVLLFVCSQTLCGTTYTFTGKTPDQEDELSPGTGHWSNPMHWDPDTGVPGGDDTAILDDGRTLILNGQFSVLIPL